MPDDENIPSAMPETEETIDSASPPASPLPQPTSSAPIVLQVGEQSFYVDRNTLLRSRYLESITSGRWDHNKQPNGTFFIDADPEVFKHILRFLRHDVYPLCYDKCKGHDVAMYSAIQKLANYLLVEDVVEWLSKQEYLKAVKIETSARVVDDGEDGLNGTLRESNVEVRYHPGWRTVKKYVCPRGIGSHYDRPWRCGKDCKRAQGDADDEYEDVMVLSTLVLTEKVVVDQRLLVKEE
ncbi:MAG: hypothetical protein Q9186_006683 [Xanthomendoza sp. 1 TL-2023]